MPSAEVYPQAEPAAMCPPGQHEMPDGTCMPDDEMMMFTTSGTEWHAVAVVEGDWDGAGRMVAPGALTWAGLLPQPLMWQPEQEPGHDGAVIVGRIDGATRQGPLVWAWGVFDDQGKHGAEALRLVQGEFLRGVSISADDVDEMDVELVCPMPMGEDSMVCGVEPKQVTHHARLRSLTLVAEPAFPQCAIKLGPPPAEVTETPVMTAAAVASHNTPTSTGAWDGPANEKRLTSPMAVTVGRQAYAWIDDAAVEGDQMPKTAGRFIHHEVGTGGRPGAANMTACSTGIGVLNGGRGGTTIPTDAVQGVYDHLAAHLRDGEQEPPPLTAAAAPATVTAATYRVEIPDIPPEEWFDEPTDDVPFGALHITAAGRVYGWLAPPGVTHRAFRASGQHITPPQHVDYSEFMNKPALVADSTGQIHTINAGNITFGCGHMSPVDPRRANPAAALDHYDNSCSVAARVRAGERDGGTWVAGALLHDVTPSTVERMMACALSGDWQGGRLNAALLVPVEGFPTTVRGSVRVKAGAVVASTTPLRFHTRPPVSAQHRLVFDQLARMIGRDPASRMRELKARVDATRGGD